MHETVRLVARIHTFLLDSLHNCEILRRQNEIDESPKRCKLLCLLPYMGRGSSRTETFGCAGPCMYVCMYVNTRVYKYTHTYTYTYIHLHMDTYT